jgi:hypothetical protein
MGEVIALTGSLIVSHACARACVRAFQRNLYEDHTELKKVFTVQPTVT